MEGNCSGIMEPSFRSRNNYTLSFKLRVLERLKELGGNVPVVSREFRVGNRSIRRWQKQEFMIREGLKNEQGYRARFQKRIANTRRDVNQVEVTRLSQVEEKLSNWLGDVQKDGALLQSEQIKRKAFEFAKEISCERIFFPTNDWLQSFIATHNANQQHKAKAANDATQAVNFYQEVDSIISRHGIVAANIANMDEIEFHFELPTEVLVDCENSFTNLHFSVLFCAMANGLKLKPMVVFKNLESVSKGKYPENCLVDSVSGSKLTQNQVFKWCRNIWERRPFSAKMNPGLIVLHPHAYIDDYISMCISESYNTSIVFVPLNLKQFLQPCASCWKTVIEDQLSEKWFQWSDISEKEFVKTGKRKPLMHDIVAEWVVNVWESLDDNIITYSFVKCGITGCRNMNDFHSELKELMVDNGIQQSQLTVSCIIEETVEDKPKSNKNEIELIDLI